jgi:hypothetical protein
MCRYSVKQLLREANTPQNRRDLSISLDRLGILYEQHNKLENALTYYEKSFALIEALYQTTPVPRIERRLSKYTVERVTKARKKLQKKNKKWWQWW